MWIKVFIVIATVVVGFLTYIGFQPNKMSSSRAPLSGMIGTSTDDRFAKSAAPDLGQILWTCDSNYSREMVKYNLVMRLRKADDRLQFTLSRINTEPIKNLVDLAAETWEPKDKPIKIANAKAGLSFEIDLTQQSPDGMNKGVLKSTGCCFNDEAKLVLPMEFFCRAGAAK